MAFPMWVVGVSLAFTGSVLSNLGVNLQKLSHDKQTARQRSAATEVTQKNPLIAAKLQDSPKPTTLAAEPPPARRASVCSQPLWLLGLGCIAIGSVMDLVSFAFAPLSLLAPLGAMVRPVGVLAGDFPELVAHPVSWCSFGRASGPIVAGIGHCACALCSVAAATGFNNRFVRGV